MNYTNDDKILLLAKKLAINPFLINSKSRKIIKYSNICKKELIEYLSTKNSNNKFFLKKITNLEDLHSVIVNSYWLVFLKLDYNSNKKLILGNENLKNLEEKCILKLLKVIKNNKIKKDLDYCNYTLKTNINTNLKEILSNINFIYNTKSLNYYKQKDIKNSIFYLQKAMNIRLIFMEKNYNEFEYHLMLINLSVVYYKNKNIESLKLIYKSLIYFEEIDIKLKNEDKYEFLFEISQNILIFPIKIKKDKYLEFINNALKSNFFKKIYILKLLSFSYKLLSKILKILNRYIESDESFNNYWKIKKKLNSILKNKITKNVIINKKNLIFEKDK